jgi:hypothetical protein
MTRKKHIQVPCVCNFVFKCVYLSLIESMIFVPANAEGLPTYLTLISTKIFIDIIA